MTKNAYIHIPFCKGKCNYCTFTSFVCIELKEDYLKALKKQIIAEYKKEKLQTLYFGGGTPSLLTIEEFKDLLDLFKTEKNAEITVEVNPDSVNCEYLKNLKKLGINRISIGAQSFNDKFLKLIGRIHNSEQIESALNCALQAGFNNISLDFIYGLPNQTLSDFENDLKKAVKLNIQHISLYGLKIEEGCYFYKNPPKDLPNLDLQADMYLKAIEILKDAGFEHYEISNFAKPGFASNHNLNYWGNNTYYGFGCSASGYLNETRYQIEPVLEKYIQNPFKRDFKQKLTQEEILEEAIFLGFRKIAGINTNEINKNFDIEFDNKYSKTLNKYSKYFERTKDGWKLSIEGILISNEILSEFIEI